MPAYGDGSVYKDKASGRWRAQLFLGVDAEGKRRYWTAWADKQYQAKELLQDARTERDKGRLVATSRSTLADYLTYWLNAIRPTVASKWYVERERYVKTTLIPKLGTVTLDKLRPPIIQKLVSDLHAEGRSARWIEVCLGTLKKALGDAVDWELLGSNPALRVKTPKVERREVPVWTPAQLRKFLEAMHDDADSALYVVAILTGARAGELCALTWSDVDWQSRTLSLNRAVTYVRGSGLQVKDTKTPSGRRLLSLPPEALDALRRQQKLLAAWRLRTGPLWQDLGLVFPKRDGGLRSADAPRRKLEKTAGELGLPVLTFHDLRHLHGSLLVALGVPLKIVQARLGHSSVEVTGDVYAHLLPGSDQDAADRLSGLF
jgi:integrase